MAKKRKPKPATRTTFKQGQFTSLVTKRGKRITVALLDGGGKPVAKGTGNSLGAARNRAYRNAKNEDAKLWLRTVMVINAS